ncbi:hypothetical protein HNY73_013171 [Argiope bruennichi]|uniref:Uncharacterized protein n=1 Tax=Argiope bruennichi TaxID=94029 RepID=A0A8T0F332_ARGBR|nr:hypothetical protein HNY73_013171 [Argiope bruennichi]
MDLQTIFVASVREAGYEVHVSKPLFMARYLVTARNEANLFDEGIRGVFEVTRILRLPKYTSDKTLRGRGEGV